jgi:hypothetical protein
MARASARPVGRPSAGSARATAGEGSEGGGAPPMKKGGGR